MSETVRRLVSSTFKPDDRVWLLPNRVDFDVMRPDVTGDVTELSQKYPFKYRIVHVGRKVPEKNLDNLIRSLRLLGPEYCLLAVGKGPTAPYAQIASGEGVSDRCFFIDAIPHDQLARYFSWADCSCTPSRSEAFAMVVIEALASGAMVIASDIPALRELIVHGHNGLLISDYENPAAIAEVVKTACSDQRVRGVAMANARGSVEPFERSRIDALEACYYQKVLDLRAAGAFHVPLRKKIHRSVGPRARRVLLERVKQTLKPLIGRYRHTA